MPVYFGRKNTLSMQITRYQIALNKPGNERRAQYAAKMLKKFKWTPEQRALLQLQAEKGYWIGNRNEAERVFGLRQTPNGNRRCILVYGYYSTKPENKKSQVIWSL